MNKNMTITLIGAGNVATHLASAFAAAGHNLQQVYSHSLENAEKLARQYDAAPTNQLAAVGPGAGLYIFAVKDRVLEHVIRQTPDNDGVWAHTAGSMPMSVFEGKHPRHGVFYPLQTFSKARSVNMAEVPFCLEAASPQEYEILSGVAASLGAASYPVASEKRKSLHLAAVFACNFVNHLYDQAQEILCKESLPFELLRPLILETAQKVQHLQPRQAQTGPAVRYDENIIQHHLQMLAPRPKSQSLYHVLSQQIFTFASQNK